MLISTSDILVGNAAYTLEAISSLSTTSEEIFDALPERVSLQGIFSIAGAFLRKIPTNWHTKKRLSTNPLCT